MRVLHVVPTYYPATRYGGPIRSVHGLCKGLVDRGHKIEVFTTNVDGSSDSEVSLNTPEGLEGVKITYFQSSIFRRLYWAPGMFRVLRQRMPEFGLLHIHSVFLWPTWAAARMARKHKVPYVLTPRGMLVKDLIWRKSRWLKMLWISLIERQNLERAAALHLTTRLEREALHAFGFQLPQLYEIPNGLEFGEPTVSQDKVDEKMEKPFVLYLGRVNWQKGLDRLVRAWGQIPEIRLVIAGNDEENYTGKLQSLVKECDVLDRIDFIGPVNDSQKQQLFRNAKLMVLPSYSENFGMVVLEALAEGCPVVVTEEVGAKDIVIESGGGIVTPGGSEMLAAAINKLLADPERKLRGERAAQYVRERYCWDAIAEQMEMAYTEILAEAGRV